MTLHIKIDGSRNKTSKGKRQRKTRPFNTSRQKQHDDLPKSIKKGHNAENEDMIHKQQKEQAENIKIKDGTVVTLTINLCS